MKRRKKDRKRLQERKHARAKIRERNTTYQLGYDDGLRKIGQKDSPNHQALGFASRVEILSGRHPDYRDGYRAALIEEELKQLAEEEAEFQAALDNLRNRGYNT